MVSKDRIVSEFITLASMDAPTGSERPVADYCIRALEALGFRVTEDDAGAALGGSAGNLHAFLAGEGNPILFSCHMDTVTPCLAKQIIQEPDGRIHTDGRTILGADDAAGIAEILEGVRSVLEDRLAHRPVEVVLSVSEEQKLLGAKHFDIHQLHAKEAYILDVDGPIGTAVIAAPRAYRFFATVHGRSAHAALSPELGINAAVIAAEAIAQLPWGRLDADTTSNVGIVRVEGAANIVPAECYLDAEVRSLDPQKADARIETMREAFESACARHGGHLELTVFRSYDAYQVPEAHPVVTRFQRACRSAGIEPQLTRSCGGSDNSVYTPQGITGIVVAPGMHEIHGVNEYTSAQELTAMAQVVAALITDFDHQEDGL